MCGIFGVSEDNVKLVNSLIKASSHRGPDGSGIWSNAQVTLGQNLLAITDSPESSNQPMISKLGNVLVYNGEIFNYDELKKRFSNQFSPKTNCDTELLLWLLENKSLEDITDNLVDSMHAFVFYNKKNNTLVLSRDHAGIKPLYFSHTNGRLVFGSEIKGLRKIVENSSNINIQSFVCMAQCGMNFLRSTLFKGINKLNPGETLIYDLNSKNFKKLLRNVVRPKSNKNLNIDEFKNEFQSAVSESALGIRKFGVFLSGGLDSTALTLELSKKIQTLETFTNFFHPNVIDQTDNYNDDFENAVKFCKEFEIINTPVKIQPKNIYESWNKTIHYMEEPRYNWNLPMYFYTNQFLSQQNIIVTFSGDMGDELLGGYEKYFNFKKMQNKPKNWRELVYLWMHRFVNPIKLNVKFNFNELHEVLCAELPSEVWNPDDPLNSLMALDCITCVSEDFFSRNDKFGMAASMEGRFPFASKKFMKYALSIHSQYKIGDNINQLKLPIKKSYENILPNYIINKPKSGWSVPIMNWVESDSSLKSLYHSTIIKNDCLSKILNSDNYKIPKPKIISWMLRSWAQQNELNL